MGRRIIYLLLLCWVSLTASAQVTLHSESFETDGEGVRYNSNTYSYCPTDPDYFLRTNTNPVLPGGCAAGFGSTLINLQGSFFWAGEDIMSNQLPFPGNHAPGQITTQNINIASYNTLTVSLYLATASNNAARWENADSINIQAKIDGGAYRTVGRFMGSSPAGGRLRIDGNLDGAITGADPLTNCDTVAFTKYTFNITGAGTTLNIRLDFDQFGGTEEIAIDLIEVKGFLSACSPPTITCPSAQTLALNAICQATLPSYSSLATVTGNCSPTVTQSPAVGSLQSNPGSLVVSLFATNTALQSNTCTFTVNKVDAIAPTITCPGNVTTSASPGLCTGIATYVAPVGTDNCTGATTTRIAGLASGAVFSGGVNLVTYRVTDGSGNTATCSFTVNIVDLQDPTITCPATQTLALDANCQAVLPNYSSLVITSDNCTGQPVVSQSPSAGSIQTGAGPLTVSMFAVDAALNSNTCTFTVNKIDAIAPTITCPPNQGYPTDPGNCSAALNYVTPVGTDNCSGATTALIAGYANGAAAPPGSTTIIYRVTDASGNSATCSFIVNVTDQENPTIICPANITAFTDPNSCFATVNYTMPTGSDNCGIAQITISNGLPSGSTFFQGPTPITLNASDLSSNVGSCSFIITVVDNESPVAFCQDITAYLDGSGTATISPSQIDNGSSDNCQVANQSLDVSTFSCANIGSNTVVLTVTDADTNAATCTATVTVLDTIAPSALCQPTTLVLDINGSASLLPGSIDGGSTDNCAITTMTLSPQTFNTSNIGLNNVVFTVSDGSGNSATCTAVVTVVDTAVGISDPLLGQILFTLSPNPAQDRLQVEVECKICMVGDDIALQLWSLNGQLLRSLPISSDVRRQVIALDLSGLAASNYMLRLLHNERAISRQLIKL